MLQLTARQPNIHENCTCVTTGQIYSTGTSTCINLYDLAQSQSADKEDLLRAVLIFACSTIDSVGKQLTKDCLKELIDNDEGAQKTFEQYISRRIDRDAKKILARALSNPDYRGELIKVLQESIEVTSLQSYAQISELTARFGIITDDIVTRAEAEKIFDIRQKIIHEMDIEVLATSGTQAQRRTRAENELKELTEQILEACCKLIEAVHNKIHEPRVET